MFTCGKRSGTGMVASLAEMGGARVLRVAKKEPKGGKNSQDTGETKPRKSGSREDEREKKISEVIGERKSGKESRYTRVRKN